MPEGSLALVSHFQNQQFTSSLTNQPSAEISETHFYYKFVNLQLRSLNSILHLRTPIRPLQHRVPSKCSDASIQVFRRILSSLQTSKVWGTKLTFPDVGIADRCLATLLTTKMRLEAWRTQRHISSSSSLRMIGTIAFNERQ
jgi:hypothetical protein